MNAQQKPERRRPVPRWWEFGPDNMIFCGPPGAGHHIPNNFDFVEAGWVFCRHWIPDAPGVQGHECGQLVFVYRFRGGFSLTAAVSRSEKEEMKRLATPAAMVEYLGVFEDMRRRAG